MIPSSHSRSGGSRRTRTVDYQYGYDDMGEHYQQQLQPVESTTYNSSHSRSHSRSRGRGILRRIPRDYRSDDSYSSSSMPRSRDSSVDSCSLPQSSCSDWGMGMNDHRMPLSGSGRGPLAGEGSCTSSGRPGRLQRRASLSTSERSEVSFRNKKGKPKRHNPFNNPFIDIPKDIPKKTQKALSISTSRRKLLRRNASTSDVHVCSNDEESVSDSQRGMGMSMGKFQRRGSLENTTNTTCSTSRSEALHNSFGHSSFGHRSLDLNTSFNASSSGLPANFTSKKGRMARRSSMGDTPSSNNWASKPQPISPQPTLPLQQQTQQQQQEQQQTQQQQPLPQTQQLQTQPPPTPVRRVHRRNSLTHVSSSAAPRPKSILRKSSPGEVTETSSDDGSSDYSMPLPTPQMSRSSSLSNVLPSNEAPKPLKSSMKMSRRGSMNDVVSTTTTATTTQPLEPAMPLKSAMKMPRRGSMNDAAPTSTPKTMMNATMMNENSRGTLSNDLQPQVPRRGILRHGSMSDVAAEPSSNDLPYRVVPTKMGRMETLNDTPKTASLHDSNSIMSYRLSSMTSRLSSLSDGPKSAMKQADKLTPLYSESHSMRSGGRLAQLNGIAEPPLNDGLMGMGGGYCVPLKSMSERNDRTTVTSLRGKEVEKSPLSMSERSTVSNSRRSFRSGRTNSSYYSDRVTMGSSMSGLSMSVSSIPTDVFDTYHDSMISHLGGRGGGGGGGGGGSNRTNRSYYCESGSDDSCSSFGDSDDDHSLHLDEMESSTRSGGIDKKIGIISFANSWSINQLAADQSLNDSQAASTLFPDRSQRSRTSFGIPRGAMDVNSGENSGINLDGSSKLMNMEEDTWDHEDDSLPDFHGEEEPQQGRRGSMQLTELVPRPMKRISSLAFDESGESLGFGQSSNSFDLDKSTKSITWKDEEDFGASYGASLGASLVPSRRGTSRRSSLASGTSSKRSLTWKDDSLAPASARSIEVEYGSDDDIDLSGSPTSLLSGFKQDSDRSLGDFAEAALSGSFLEDSDGSLGDIFPSSPAAAAASGARSAAALTAEILAEAEEAAEQDSDSDGSLGDFAATAAAAGKQDSDGSLGDFATSAAKQDSDGSLGDFATTLASRRSSFVGWRQGSDGSLGDFVSSPVSPRVSYVGLNSSDGSLGDFAGSGLSSGRMRSCFKQGSNRSLDFGESTDSDEESLSEESDGIIRDDELFQDAFSKMVEPTVPFQKARSPIGLRRSIGDKDYTLTLSGKGGEILDIDRSEKSTTFGRRRSISSIPASAIDTSTRSRAFSTISEDSFELTAEELGIYDHADGKNLKLKLMQGRDDDDGSFMSCSSDEYASSDEFYDSDEEREKKVKEGLMWGLGTLGLGAVVGWIAKFFRKGGDEDGMDVLDMDTLHDDLGQSIAQSVLDESVNFTGSEQLWGWASLGDGGASGELIMSALHLPGTETAIISAATGGGGATTGGTAAGAAAAAATANTMAVTAAGNVGAIAVTTTAVIGNSAIATGAGIGIGGAASGATGAGSSVLAALGLSSSTSSAAAVMGSTIGALAVAGTTYYSSSYGVDPTSGYGTIIECLHPNPDIQTGIVKLSLDVSGLHGTEESWGWMPFSNVTDANSTSPEILKDVWEELFALAYNNITDNGCSELYERRVLDANLTATTHTGHSDDSDAVLETEWTVTVSCYENCPTEPIFGSEFQRRLEPETEAPTFMPTINGTNTTDKAYGSNYTKTLISELDFRSLFETTIQEVAQDLGWGKPIDQVNENIVDLGNGVFINLPPTPQERSPSESPTEDPTESPTEDPTESYTKDPTETPTLLPTDEPIESPTKYPTEGPTEAPSTPNIFTKRSAYAWPSEIYPIESPSVTNKPTLLHSEILT